MRTQGSINQGTVFVALMSVKQPGAKFPSEHLQRGKTALRLHNEKTTKNMFSVHALLLEINCVKSTLLKKAQ